MNEHPYRYWCVVLLLAAAGPVAAQVTEVSTTAPRGRWLLEVDAASVAYDRHTPANDGVEYRSTTVGSTLFSTGLTDKLDLELGFDFWHEDRALGPGVDDRYVGHGDGWLRCKWNFSGDEATGSAWALLPYLKLPVASADVGNQHYEPGVLVVWGAPWSDCVALNANLGGDWIDDGAGGRDLAVSGSAAVRRALNDRWTVYGEVSFWLDLPDSGHGWGQIGAGFNRGLGKAGWIDGVVYLGATKAAPDIMPVLRFGWQF